MVFQPPIRTVIAHFSNFVAAISEKRRHAKPGSVIRDRTGAETSHLAFVSKYVRDIGITEELRELAAKEVTEPGANKNAAMIRSGTRIVLELTSQVAILKSMSLNPPFDDMPAAIAAFYQQKIDAYNKMIAMATAFVQGPKPGVD